MRPSWISATHRHAMTRCPWPQHQTTHPRRRLVSPPPWVSRPNKLVAKIASEKQQARWPAVYSRGRSAGDPRPAAGHCALGYRSAHPCASWTRPVSSTVRELRLAPEAMVKSCSATRHCISKCWPRAETNGRWAADAQRTLREPGDHLRAGPGRPGDTRTMHCARSLRTCAASCASHDLKPHTLVLKLRSGFHAATPANGVSPRRTTVSTPSTHRRGAAGVLVAGTSRPAAAAHRRGGTGFRRRPIN